MIRVVKGLNEAKKAISDIRVKQKKLMNEKGFSEKVQNILSEEELLGDQALKKYTEELNYMIKNTKDKNLIKLLKIHINL